MSLRLPQHGANALASLCLTLLVGCGSGDYLRQVVGPRRLTFGRLDLPCNADSDCAQPSRCVQWDASQQRTGACLITCKPEKDGRGDCPWPLVCAGSAAGGPPLGATCTQPNQDEWRCWRPNGSDLACEVREVPVASHAPAPKRREWPLGLSLFLALVLLPLLGCVWLARRRGRYLPATTPSGIRTAWTVLTFLFWTSVVGSVEISLAILLFGLRPGWLAVVSWCTAALYGWLARLIGPSGSPGEPPA